MLKKIPEKYIKAIYILFGIAIWFGLNKFFTSFVITDNSSEVPTNFRLVLSLMAFPYLVSFPLFCILIGKLPRKDLVPIKKSKTSTFFAALIVQSGISIIVLALTSLFMQKVIGQAPGTNLPTQIQNNMIFYVILLLVFNPIMEELLFRKIILERLTPYGNMFAIISSAIIFAIPHAFSIGVPQMFYTFILGIIWAYMAIMNGNIYLSIILHSFSNLWGTFIPLFLMAMPNGDIVYTLVTLLLVPIVSVIILILNRNKLKIS